MSRHLLVGLAALLVLAACAGAPPAPAPVAPAPEAPGAALVSLARIPAVAPALPRATATLELVAPAPRYDLKADAAAKVHRWLPADILRYKVVLAERKPDDSYDVAAGVEALVPIKGPAPKTKAVFTEIPQGKFYRAFVTAQGNVDGVVADPFEDSVFTTMNATAATADFDFTGTNDVTANLTRSVQIVFDDVPFSGTANVTFDTPAEGKFSQPTTTVTGTAQ